MKTSQKLSFKQSHLKNYSGYKVKIYNFWKSIQFALKQDYFCYALLNWVHSIGLQPLQARALLPLARMAQSVNDDAGKISNLLFFLPISFGNDLKFWTNCIYHLRAKAMLLLKKWNRTILFSKFCFFQNGIIDLLCWGRKVITKTHYLFTCKMVNFVSGCYDKLPQKMHVIWVEVFIRVITPKFQDNLQVLCWKGCSWSLKITDFWSK